jgi:hypothetical protein
MEVGIFGIFNTMMQRGRREALFKCLEERGEELNTQTDERIEEVYL